MRKLSIYAVPLLALAHPVAAQDAVEEEVEVTFYHPAPLPNPRAITVVATGMEGIEGHGLHPVSALIDSEIRAIQGPDITRVLRRLPGVSLSRNGGPGSFTGLFVRGAASDQLLVLVDGMPVNDPASPGGGFDFGSLTSGEMGKVELLRGAHSVIWGSDAIGGVMNISSRNADGLQAAAEYGGEEQFSADAAWGMDSHLVDIGLSGGFSDASGFSAADGGAEDDGFRQWNLGARAQVWLADHWALSGRARYLDASVEIDGFPAPDYTLADTLERQDTRQTSGHMALEWSPPYAELRASLGYSRTHRDLVDEAVGDAPTFTAEGDTLQASVMGRYDIPSGLDELSFDFGADWQRDTFVAAGAFSTDEGEAENTSAHTLVTFEDEFTLSAGLRYDDHSRFGGEWSFGAAGQVPILHYLDLRASYGEGFKAPTLYQLLSEYGNLALMPERSRSFDLGISFSPDRRINLGLSLFRRDSRDLIDFTSCTGVTDGICTDRPYGTYDNIARARAQGFEVEGDILFGQDYASDLHIRANWSYVAATNRTPGSPLEGNRLARRPRHTANLSADWAMSAGLFSASLGIDFRFASASFDDAANNVRLGSYALADIRASRPLVMLASGQRTLDLTARIENIWNEEYQTAAGYGTRGRAVFVGLRAAL